MSNIGVTCGCGRKMREIGNAPKGTFTCGCGARVSVETTNHAQCAGLNGDQPCRIKPSLKATGLGLAICEDHLRQLTAIVRYEELNEAQRSALVEEQVRIIRAAAGSSADEQLRTAVGQAAELYDSQSVVYYLRIGDSIKIGTTVNMQTRMAALRPDEIMATEPGSYELEELRHEQFAALKIAGRGRERFRAEEPLLSHIAMIRNHFGEPKLTGYLTTEDGIRIPPPSRHLQQWTA